MNRGLSIWLDTLRVWATIIVVLSHVAYPRFTRGDYIFIRELNLGSDGVIVFFVISGLVIAYAAGRDAKLSTYAFNRLTRLLSVLVPALVLTFVLDQIGRGIGPDAYSSFYTPLHFTELMTRGLSMSNEWGAFERVRLGTNGPLWSLSYEAGYYLLFAAAYFLSGVRRIAILGVLVLLVGPRVLLLMPAWLMGVWLWNWMASGGPAKLSAGKARVFAWGGPMFYAYCLWAGVPDRLADLTAVFFAPTDYRMVLGFSNEFVWNALLGAVTALHIMGMARLLQGYQGRHPHIRWWAGASFSIYVTHYPALHIIDAIFPAETLARDGLLVVGSILVGLLFAQIFERKIGSLRARLLSLHKAVQDQNPRGWKRRTQ
ncbi:MAG: acyltransferase [Paracoccaceae bacterium]